MVIGRKTDDISVHTASVMLSLTPQRITQMIRAGVFKTAFKPGYGKKNCHWRIKRWEVADHKLSGHRPLSLFS